MKRDQREKEARDHFSWKAFSTRPFYTCGFIQAPMGVPGCAHRCIEYRHTHAHALFLQPSPFFGTFYSLFTLFSRQPSKSPSPFLRRGPSPLHQPQKRSISSLTSSPLPFQSHKTFSGPRCFNISFLRALEHRKQIIHGIIPSACAAGKGLVSLLLALIM